MPMKIVHIAVRDFAVPAPRTGSIEPNSGFRSFAEGQEIHARVQQKRLQADPTYKPEVCTSQSFQRGDYEFQVSGRMDGLFGSTPPRIEEIKSTFNVYDLYKKLLDHPWDHPYCLQLKTYGYFYWLEHKILPKLSFHIVSTRNSDTQDMDVKFDLKETVVRYEEWLERRLDELLEQTKKCEKRSARRKDVASDFRFPFENPRSGQFELIQSIEAGIAEKHRMMIQAPTGLGKTAGVLFPVLRQALSRGQRVIYVTPKNSQHLVAEDAVTRFQDVGSAVKSLTLTAKAKLCFKNEPLCNPDYCEYARDHYTKVHENKLLDVLARKRKLKAKHFRELGEDFQVCPFELQLDAAPEADVVICDYNYVFSPRSALNKVSALELDQEGKANLVIDEAHNLPSRAMDYYSPSLSSFVLEKMREEMKEMTELPRLIRTEAEELLEECMHVVASCQPKDCDPKGTLIEPPLEPFYEQDLQLRAFLSRYLDSDIEIKPRDVILRLCFYWSEFTAALEFLEGQGDVPKQSDQSALAIQAIQNDQKHPEFFVTFRPKLPSGGTIKITCCDASEMLRTCYDAYEHVVGFSATLKPFDYYARLSGLNSERLRKSEFSSPFDKAQRKLLIIPQISTKYTDRARNYPRIAETIYKISEIRPGNYFAFFPSFEFLERVLEVFDPPPGFTVLRQEREMKARDIETILYYLQSGASTAESTGAGARTSPTIVFAVQGGVFSEGVDYPGEMIIGAFVVGPPLPNFDLEREQMREYYQKYYGSGFDYAYTFPAMAKAVQAAGRVIRSETDRGIIVLMDSRFIHPSYTQSMPGDWFEESPRELVSSSILQEVREFWHGSGAGTEAGY